MHLRLSPKVERRDKETQKEHEISEGHDQKFNASTVSRGVITNNHSILTGMEFAHFENMVRLGEGSIGVVF